MLNRIWSSEDVLHIVGIMGEDRNNLYDLADGRKGKGDPPLKHAATVFHNIVN